MGYLKAIELTWADSAFVAVLAVMGVSGVCVFRWANLLDQSRVDKIKPRWLAWLLENTLRNRTFAAEATSLSILALGLVIFVRGGPINALPAIGTFLLQGGSFVSILVRSIRSAFRAPSRLGVWLLAYRIGAITLIFTSVYMWVGINGPSSATYKDFGNCLYFSIITMTTVGYGDFTPSEYARPVAAVQALSGYVFLGIWISLLISLLSRKESR